MLKGKIKLYFISFALIILGFCVLGISISNYNKQERTLVIGSTDSGVFAENKDIQVTIQPRGGITDAWVKRIYEEDENGQEIEIQYAGIIYDMMVINISQDKVIDWKIRVNTSRDIYLNNAWCGKLEIHQNCGTDEKVQAIDLRKYIEKNTEIILENRMMGENLMIPIYKGDYFVYLPSIDDLEYFINPKEKINSDYLNKRVDFIAYHYIENEDLTPLIFDDAVITYHLNKEIVKSPFFAMLFALLILCILSMLIDIIVYKKTKKITAEREHDRKIIEQSINAFMGFIDAKDSGTNGHSLRVAQYSKSIAENMGYSQDECQRIYYIGLMHDCGKIGIPESILKKPEKLTPEEYEIMKKHTIYGEKILRDFTSIDGIRDGVRFHHERYDGKGYPDGLAGEDIPMIARIICVADSFDAMNSIRCYPNHLGNEEIIQQLTSNKGTQFDPKVVDCLLTLINEKTIAF